MKKILALLFFFIMATRVFATPITGITAFYRYGQVFVTWNNLSGTGVKYNLYRSAVPIASGAQLATAQNLGWVPDSSSVNKRVTSIAGGVLSFITIDSLGTPLPLNTGLFVATTTSNGNYFYAVTTTVNGVEDTTINLGQNSLITPITEQVAIPQPVLQQVRNVGGMPILYLYVQFLTAISSDIYPVMTNYGSMPANFSILEYLGTVPYWGFFKLHGGGGNFIADTSGDTINGVYDDAWNIGLDDWTDGGIGSTTWIGYNQNDNIDSARGVTPTKGLDLLFTETRIAYTIRWADRNLPIDSTKNIISGASDGAVGTIFSTSVIPDKLSLSYEYTGMFNLGFSSDPNGNVATNTGGAQRKKTDYLFGTVPVNLLDNQGMNFYNEANAAYMTRVNRDKNYPILVGVNGKNDLTVGWYEKIAFYDSANANRLGGFFYWDLRTHGGGPKAWNIIPNYSRYSTGISYPAFSNCSANSNPGNGFANNGDSIGTINGMLDWKNPTADSSTVWQIPLYIKKNLRNRYGLFPTPDSCYVDVTPRRLQNFKPMHGATIHYTNTHKGVVVQSAIATYDGDLIVVPQVKVYDDTNILRLTIDTASIDTEKSISVGIFASKLTHCQSGVYDTLTAKGAGTYQWTASPQCADCIVGGVGSSIIVEPTVTTTYTVVGANINGITGLNSIVINVISPYNASVISLGDTTFCAGTASDVLSVYPKGAIYNYSWYLDSSLVNGVTGNQYNATDSGSVYCIVMATSSTCPASISNSIHLLTLPPPIVSLLAPKTIICKGDSMQLIASPGIGAYTYSWYRNDTLIANASANTYYAKDSSSYKCRIADSLGCYSFTDSVLIKTLQVSNANLTASATIICKGDSALLTASPSGAGYTYMWFKNDTLILGDTTNRYYVKDSGNYKSLITDSLGCYSFTDSVIIKTLEVANATLTASATIICKADSSLLTASPSGAAYTYTWFKNDTLIVGDTANKYYAKDSASYKCRIANSLGCYSFTDSVLIKTLEVDNANLGASATIICKGDSALLTASPSGAAYTYMWFKNDTLIVGDTTNRYYAKDSSSYKCRIADSLGCYAFTDSVIIKTLEVANATLIASATTICKGDSALLTASPSGAAYTYMWFKNDTLIVGDTTNKYYAKDSSSYKCRIADSLGCYSFTDSVIIKTLQVSDATLTASATIICKGDSALLTASPSGAAYTYMWFKNDTLIVGDSTNKYYAKDSASYKCRIADSLGCYSFTDSVLIKMLQVSNANLTASATIICKGDSALLTASPLGAAYTYMWFKNDTLIVGDTTNKYYAKDSASYICRIADSLGCYAFTDSVIIKTLQISNANFTASATIICKGDSALLTASPLGAAYTYMWFKNDTLIVGHSTNKYYAKDSASYKCRIADSLGCYAFTDSVIIKTLQISNANFTASATIICKGDSALLTASPSGAAYTYMWFKNDTLIVGDTTNKYYAKDSASYKCRIADSLGCYAFTDSVIIKTLQVANATLTASATTICKGDSVLLTASPSGAAYTYMWFKNDTLIVGDTTNKYYAKDSSSYRCRIADSLGCYSFTDSVIIKTLQVANATLTASATIICKGDSTLLTASPSGQAYTYTWFKNDTLIVGDTTNKYYAKDSSSYKCRIADSLGCYSFTDSILIKTLEVFDANLTADTTLICKGDSAKLTASPTGAKYNYSWFRNDTLIPGAATSIYYAKDSASYKCLITDSLGCFSYTPGIVIRDSDCTVSVGKIITTLGFILSIMPNPNNGNFYLTFRTGDFSDVNLSLQIINLLGQVIYRQSDETINGEYNADINLPATTAGGLYLVKLISGEVVITKQIVISR